MGQGGCETDGLKVLCMNVKVSTHLNQTSKAVVPVRTRMGTICVMLLVTMVACQREPSSRVFHGHGIVRHLGADQKSVRIMHEKIPGFMSAMTMEFEVKDPAILAKIRPDSEVNFTLEATTDSVYLVQIESLSDSEEAAAPQQEESETAKGEEATTPADASIEFTPYLAADFTLTDQHGQSLTLSSLRGKVIVLNFIFTHCSGPCPLLSLKFSRLQQQLGDRLGKQVMLLSVTIDPRRDTPEVLTAYAQRYQANLTGWKFLTGTTQDILMVATAYGADYQATMEGVVDHRLLTCVIDQTGTVVREFTGVNYTVEDLMTEIMRVLKNPTS